jgi:hypothetical protein
VHRDRDPELEALVAVAVADVVVELHHDHEDLDFGIVVKCVAAVVESGVAVAVEIVAAAVVVDTEEEVVDAACTADSDLGHSAEEELLGLPVGSNMDNKVRGR